MRRYHKANAGSNLAMWVEGSTQETWHLLVGGMKLGLNIGTMAAVHPALALKPYISASPHMSVVLLDPMSLYQSPG